MAAIANSVFIIVVIFWLQFVGPGDGWEYSMGLENLCKTLEIKGVVGRYKLPRPL